MAETAWKFEAPLKELEPGLEAAAKRAAGLAHFHIGQDRLNTDSLAGSAEGVADNLSRSGLFSLPLIRSVLGLLSYQPKAEVSLQELAADILDEYHKEATNAFQAARARFEDQAGNRLNSLKMDEAGRQAVLSELETVWLPPPSHAMMEAARPYVKERFRPDTKAVIGGLLGLGLVFLLLRHPLLAALGGGIGAGVSYYLARLRRRQMARLLLANLSQDLGGLLLQALLGNVERGQDLVNQKVKANSDGGA